MEKEKQEEKEKGISYSGGPFDFPISSRVEGRNCVVDSIFVVELKT